MHHDRYRLLIQQMERELVRSQHVLAQSEATLQPVLALLGDLERARDMTRATRARLLTRQTGSDTAARAGTPIADEAVALLLQASEPAATGAVPSNAQTR